MESSKSDISDEENKATNETTIGKNPFLFFLWTMNLDSLPGKKSFCPFLY